MWTQTALEELEAADWTSFVVSLFAESSFSVQLLQSSRRLSLSIRVLTSVIDSSGPEKVKWQGISSPPWGRLTERRLLPVTVAVMDPPLPREREQRCAIFRGKCPTVCSPFTTMTVCVSGVSRTCRWPVSRNIMLYNVRECHHLQSGREPKRYNQVR